MPFDSLLLYIAASRQVLQKEKWTRPRGACHWVYLRIYSRAALSILIMNSSGRTSRSWFGLWKRETKMLLQSQQGFNCQSYNASKCRKRKKIALCYPALADQSQGFVSYTAERSNCSPETTCVRPLREAKLPQPLSSLSLFLAPSACWMSSQRFTLICAEANHISDNSVIAFVGDASTFVPGASLPLSPLFLSTFQCVY